MPSPPSQAGTSEEATSLRSGRASLSSFEVSNQLKPARSLSPPEIPTTKCRTLFFLLDLRCTACSQPVLSSPMVPPLLRLSSTAPWFFSTLLSHPWVQSGSFLFLRSFFIRLQNDMVFGPTTAALSGVSPCRRAQTVAFSPIPPDTGAPQVLRRR